MFKDFLLLAISWTHEETKRHVIYRCDSVTEAYMTLPICDFVSLNCCISASTRFRPYLPQLQQAIECLY